MKRYLKRNWQVRPIMQRLSSSIAPDARGSGNSFVNMCENPGLTEEFIQAIMEGVTEAADGGVLMGYPVIDTKTILIEAGINDAASDAMSFKIAAGKAFENGCRKAASYHA